MKLFAILIAMLTLTLSAIPCVDGAAPKTTLQVSVHQHAHAHDHSGFDLCSPFCTCVCCATVVLKPLFHTFESQNTPLIFKQKLVSNFTDRLPSGTGNRLFQPPRI